MATEQELPLKLTRQQQNILELVYSYRFINRIQLQELIGHKDYKRINCWLRYLREHHYLEWIYSTDFAEKTKPGIYYLGLNGIRYFHDHAFIDHPATELRKRYHDKHRSQTYIDRCQLIADCAVRLNAYNRQADSSNQESYPQRYYYETETEYRQENYFHALVGNELIFPQLCISKFESQYDGESLSVATHLLEAFDLTLPRYRLKKRLSNYIEFLTDGEWERLFGEQGDPSPSLMFICQRTTDLIFAKRYLRGILAENWDYEDDDRPKTYLTTAKQCKTEGFFGDIWELA